MTLFHKHKVKFLGRKEGSIGKFTKMTRYYRLNIYGNPSSEAGLKIIKEGFEIGYGEFQCLSQIKRAGTIVCDMYL